MKNEYNFCGGLVTKLCPTLATPWTIACQAPLSMAFSRQEYWSELPYPPPGISPIPRMSPAAPALQADSLPLNHKRSPKRKYKVLLNNYFPYCSNGSSDRLYFLGLQNHCRW